MRLAVATFNIHHGVGIDGGLDLARTAEVIAGTGAALVGLQEVDRHWSARSDWEDQPARLAEGLGMEVVFGAAIDLARPDDPDAPRRQYGNALLSAHPIVSWTSSLLPGTGEREPRSLLEAVVDVGGTTAQAAVTHLQNRAPAERLVQARWVAEALATAAEPVVLLGDMNAQPGSSTLEVLTGGLVDAWSVAGAGAGLTFDAATPHARIDYVLTSPALVAGAAWVVPGGASDHLPVVAELAWPSVPEPQFPGPSGPRY
ncbi:MAG TPA: endonuclease/exonuclease/phosphatase family protein [Acidimicrobiales bacterium]